MGDVLTVTVLADTATIPLLTGKFPPFKHLFGGEPKDVGEIALDPRLLGEFAKVPGMGKGVPMRLTFQGSNKSVILGLSHDAITWQALLMPMRFPN